MYTGFTSPKVGQQLCESPRFQVGSHQKLRLVNDTQIRVRGRSARVSGILRSPFVRAEAHPNRLASICRTYRLLPGGSNRK